MRVLLDATNFVKTVETHQHRKIACLEEIAYLNGWITKEDDIWKFMKILKKNQYGTVSQRCIRWKISGKFILKGVFNYDILS